MSTIGVRAVRSDVRNDVREYLQAPRDQVVEIRNQRSVTTGRLAWGYISDDESLIMSDTGEVWVRHGPKEIFGSEKAAEEFIQERKFMPPPTMLPGSPHDYAPFDEHLMRVIARKELHNSVASRLVRWLMASKYNE